MGTYRIAQSFIPQLQATKGGVQAFVAISSIASHFTDTAIHPVAYNVSKLCISRITEHIHNDYHEKHGVQAFAVHPGAVLTPLTENYHSTQLGELWNDLLKDDPALCGGWLTWLTSERRPWLSGRYASVTWDVDELMQKKDEIVEKDLLTVKMAL